MLISIANFLRRLAIYSVENDPIYKALMPQAEASLKAGKLPEAKQHLKSSLSAFESRLTRLRDINLAESVITLNPRDQRFMVASMIKALKSGVANLDGMRQLKDDLATGKVADAGHYDIPNFLKISYEKIRASMQALDENIPADALKLLAEAKACYFTAEPFILRGQFTPAP